jgi:hypothetical protein
VIGIAAALVAVPAAAGAEPAATLRKLSGPTLEPTRETPFDRSLWVESTELDSRLEGRIRSVIDHPFSRARALADPAHWCELLPLLPNIRHCDAASDGGGSRCGSRDASINHSPTPIPCPSTCASRRCAATVSK